MLYVIACTDEAPSGASGPAKDTLTTTVSPTLEGTAHDTVWRVRWEADDAEGWVDVSDTLGTRRHTTVGMDGVHEALLVLPASTISTVQVGGAFGVVDAGEVTTGDPPAGWPSFDLVADDGTARGFVVGGLTAEATGAYGVYVIDRHGRYVWWQEGGEARLADAHLSADGAWVEWLEWDPGGMLSRRTIDGAAQEDFDVPGIHHTFLSRGDDWVTLGTDAREYLEDVTVQGDVMVFIEPDGSSTSTWSTWDAFVPAEERLQGAIEGEGTPLIYDWTHGNGVAWDAERDKWWISLRNVDAVVQVDGATWSVDFTVGGPHGDFTLEEGEPFSYQHSPRRLADGNLLLFDNGLDVRGRSRVVEYAIDEDARSFRQVWAYEADPTIYASHTASADRLDDGATFICWGAAGILSEVYADGTLRWQVQQSDLGGLGFAQVAPVFGSASDQPGR